MLIPFYPCFCHTFYTFRSPRQPPACGSVVQPRIPEKSLFQVCKYTIYLINPQFANIFFHFRHPRDTLPQEKIYPSVCECHIYEGENETYIEASVENSGSILYDK